MKDVKHCERNAKEIDIVIDFFIKQWIRLNGELGIQTREIHRIEDKCVTKVGEHMISLRDWEL